jgi:hypothetical protein
VEVSELDIQLTELEQNLDRLRALYEQYFMGMEKVEPAVLRKDVDRRFWQLRRIKIRNTAKRFKFQTLVQRYNTFQQHWTRTCREIDTGTYTKHLKRVEKTFGVEALTNLARKRKHNIEKAILLDAERKAAIALRQGGIRPPQPNPIQAPAGDEPATPESRRSLPPPLPQKGVRRISLAPLALAPTAEIAPRPAAAVARPDPHLSRPTASLATGHLSDARVRDLHERLIATKRGLNEEGKVSLENLAKSLRATEEKLRAKHGARSIDFQVVVKDGKAVVKPLLR